MIKQEAIKVGAPSFGDYLSYVMLHEFTHVCSARVSMNEVDNYIFGLALYGKTPWNTIDQFIINGLCKDDHVARHRLESNLSGRYLPGRQFLIDLETGKVFTIPITVPIPPDSEPVMVLEKAPFEYCP